MSKIIEYLETKGFKFKGQGIEVSTNCIFCNDEKNHLYINRQKELFHCAKCNEAGNLWKLKRHFGELEIYQPKTTEYKKPRPELIDILTKRLDEKALNFLTKERGLSLQIIKEFKLGAKEGYVSIPYYKNKELVGIKYRSITEKRYEREKDCESTLFNIDNINHQQDLIITEGEFDCIAAYQIGLKNVISTPIGASGFNNNWIDWFDSTTGNIYIAYDNDNAGDKGAEKLAKRIGLHRCYRVRLPQKDFNDCLMTGFKKEEMKACLDSAQAYKLPHLIPADIAMERLRERIFGDKNEITGIKTKKFLSFNEKIGGLRKGEITVITGETGSGKSTYALNIIHDLMEQDKRILIISTEMKPSSIVGKFYSMHLNCPYYNCGPEEINIAENWLAKKILLFVDVHGEISIESIEEYIEYVKRKYDVEFVLLDHLHYFLRTSDNMVQEIENFMRGLVKITLKNDMNIFLIAHPSKLKNESGQVHMNDIKGASAIKQDAHNILTIWRNLSAEEKGINEVGFFMEKVRDDSGKVGKFKMEFDSNNQRYSEIKK